MAGKAGIKVVVGEGGSKLDGSAGRDVDGRVYL